MFRRRFEGVAMQLPDITIPLTLPFSVPLMLHPVFVHFAMTLPLIVLLVELANLLFKRRALSVTSLVLLLVAVFVYLAVYFTGKADGSEAFALLDGEAKEALQAHRLLGTYLIYGLTIPLVFKLTAMLLRQKWARGALIVSLVMFISFMFKQGYDGGELTYKYGVNVQPVGAARASAERAEEASRELNATVREQNATIGALRGELETCKSGCIGQAVDEAVTSIKKIFVDGNKTAPAASKEANATKAATAMDTNDTNRTE
jgi:uncharacterized membrane protein